MRGWGFREVQVMVSEGGGVFGRYSEVSKGGGGFGRYRRS